MEKNLIAVGIILAIAFVTGTYFVTREPTEVKPLPTQLTVTPSESAIPWGGFEVLTATLTSNGNPVEGENIEWSISLCESADVLPSSGVLVGVSPNSSITNPIGKSSVEFWTSYFSSIAPGENAITFLITASFAGSSNYQGSSENISIIVTWS